jgi:hypothetical protein
MFWMTATAGLMVGTPGVAMAYLFTTVVIDVGGMDRQSAATATVPTTLPGLVGARRCRSSPANSSDVGAGHLMSSRLPPTCEA